MFYPRRLSDVLKRKKPPKRSLGRKCKNSEESQTDTPPKGSPAVGGRSSNRAKSAGKLNHSPPTFLLYLHLQRAKEEIQHFFKLTITKILRENGISALSATRSDIVQMMDIFI